MRCFNEDIEDSVPSISSFLCVTIINQNHEIISLASWQHFCGIKKMHLVSHYTTLVTLLIHWYKKTWTIWVQKVKQQVFIIVSDSIWFHYPLFFIFYFTKPEGYLGTCQTFMVEFLLKIANSFQSLTIFAENSIIDIWQGPKYSSKIFAPNC